MAAIDPRLAVEATGGSAVLEVAYMNYCYSILQVTQDSCDLAGFQH